MSQKLTLERSTQDSSETKAILRRMEEVRRDLNDGAQEIVESARDLGEWRHYVKSYPWICLGAACAIGYAIVPRRRSGFNIPNPTLAQLTDHGQPLMKTPSASTNGVRSVIKMFAGNLLWRSALSYAARQAEQYFITQSVISTPED